MSLTTSLLIIDPQVDFHKGGSLAVPGADEDAERLAAWIEKMFLDHIFVSLDTHEVVDVAHPRGWEGPGESHPEPFSSVTLEEVQSGLWSTAIWGLEEDERLYAPRERVEAYLKAVEERGHTHTIWPQHCVRHTKGHAVVEPIFEALTAWGLPVEYIYKGESPYQEQFSVFETLDGQITNAELAWTLRGQQRVYIAGQALSHCVAESCRYLMRTGDVRRFTLLTDATSPVPGFEEQAEQFVQDWIAAGGQVRTTLDKMPPSLVQARGMTLPYDTAEDTDRITQARKWCVARHDEVNQTYDGHSYGYHLALVASEAKKHGSAVLTPEGVKIAICGAWAHDVIEDAQQSYQDVAKVLGEDVAEVAFKLTNNRGRTRAERQGGDYYPLIASCPVATFVKCCDRLANVGYSASKGSSMFKKYCKEHEGFFAKLRAHGCDEAQMVLDYMEPLIEAAIA